MSDKILVEEMARAMREKLHELDADPPFHADALAQAAATIAERRMEEMRKALERIAASMPGNTHKENSVARQEIARAALRPSGGV
jgi:hypothetical protein